MLPLPSSLLLAATSAAVLLVLCSLPVASARPLTSCSFISSDGSYFDFSELHSEGSDGVRVGSSDEAATVFVNLCGRTMIAPACVNVDAAVCLQYHSDPTWYAIAESSWHDPPVFSLIKPGRSEKGVRASYRNGFTKGAKPAAVGVDLICSDAESPQYSIRHTSEHAWRLTITGRAACPKPRNVCHVELKDGTMFDLNGLRTKNGAFVKTNSSAVFNINPCGVAYGDSSDGICGTHNATVCFQPSAHSLDWYALANLQPESTVPEVREIVPGQPEKGLVQQWTNGYGEHKREASVRVRYFCTQQEKTTYAAEQIGPTEFTIDITSPIACSQPRSARASLFEIATLPSEGFFLSSEPFASSPLLEAGLSPLAPGSRVLSSASSSRGVKEQRFVENDSKTMYGRRRKAREGEGEKELFE